MDFTKGKSRGHVLHVLELSGAVELRLEPEEHAEPFAHVGDDISWSLRLEYNSSSLPVEVFHVIREDNAGDRATRRQGDLERITFLVAGDWARNRETGFRIIDARRQYQRGPPPALLVTGLGIECQPNEIASVRYVRAGYHVSWPTGSPQSSSLWRF